MIRFKVFLPVLILTILIGWFFVYRLDAWLEKAIEDGVSSITNTKTEIQSLKLSFQNSSLVIRGLKIASPKDEFKNLVEFADIVIDFQSLPLLEKRFVIDDFSIRGIAWNTPRKTSGWLPPKPKKDEPSWISEQIDKAFGKIKEEFQELPVAKLADFRIPQNPQEVLSALDLESEKAFRESAIKFQESRTKWENEIRELRDISEYRRFSKNVENLTKALPPDPKEILKRVETAKEAIEFFKTEKTKAQNLFEDLKAEGQNLKETYAAAVRAIDSDFERARALVSLDQFNIDNLSRLLFGAHWVNDAERVLYYHAVLREKLEILKDEGESVEVRQRARGRDIIFVVPQKKPGFVLANSEFTVTGLESEEAKRLSQTYQLHLQHINSAPKLYGKPTEIHMLGKFKEAPISLAAIDLFWDYTKDIPRDRYTAKLERIAVKNWPVGVPKILPLKMQSGFANSKSDLEFIGSEMRWTNSIQFSNVNWDFREVPKIGFIVPALVDTLEQVRNFYLEIELKKRDSGLEFIVRSDLDRRLKEAISNVIDEKFQEFQAKLRASLEAQVERYKDEAQKQLALYQKEVLGRVEEQLTLANKYQKQAEDKLKELQKRAGQAASEQLKDRAKDKMEDLKKDLPKIKNPF